MAGTDQLSIDQDPIQIASRICEHSKVCSTILDDWRTVWDITILPEYRIVQITCNEDIRMHTFQHSSKENTLLAAVRSSDEVALLYTVTSRQGTPLCSLCTVRNCRHAYSYDNHKDEDISNFLSTVNTGGEPFESNLLSQAGSAPAPHQSHPEDLVAQPDDANVDGSSESEYGSENDYVPTNGERGKNPNYWVSIAFWKYLFYRTNRCHNLGQPKIKSPRVVLLLARKTTPPHHWDHYNLSHFQATYEADFGYATLF